MQLVRLAAAVSLAGLLGGWSLQENVVARAATRAGVVAIVAAGEPPVHAVVVRGGTRLYQAPTYGVDGAGLAIARVFARTAPDEDVVVLSQSDGGTECRAEYVLVAVRRGRPASVSAPFGNCATPVFAREGQRLRFSFPRAGEADPEVWVYAAGRLARRRRAGGPGAPEGARRIRLAEGASQVVMRERLVNTGEVEEAFHVYLARARGGDVLRVTLSSAGGRGAFRLTLPGGTVVEDGAGSPAHTRWQGRVPRPGDVRIEVSHGAGPHATAYTLRVERR